MKTVSDIESLDSRVSGFFSLPHFSLKKIITWRVLVVAMASLAFSVVCYVFHIVFDLSSINTIFFSVIGFPLSLILSQAESRRFSILENISEVKAHLLALAYAYSDWRPSSEQKRAYYQEQLMVFIASFREFLLIKGTLDDYVPGVIVLEDALHNLSLANEEMRKEGVPANEISRANQYLDRILVACETLRSYKYYHTSRTLTSFLTLFVVIGSVLFAPYYVSLGGLYGVFVGPFIAVSFLSLINIQKLLDEPFSRSDIIDGVNLDFVRRFHIRLEHIFSVDK